MATPSTYVSLITQGYFQKLLPNKKVTSQIIFSKERDRD